MNVNINGAVTFNDNSSPVCLEVKRGKARETEGKRKYCPVEKGEKKEEDVIVK